jgi:hypothetical protein
VRLLSSQDPERVKVRNVMWSLDSENRFSLIMLRRWVLIAFSMLPVAHPNHVFPIQEISDLEEYTIPESDEVFRLAILPISGQHAVGLD